MMCHHKNCLCKIYPQQPIPINNNILYNYGKIINNNYTQNIYNCCNKCSEVPIFKSTLPLDLNKDPITDIKQDNPLFIDKFGDVKIFEDNELNELIFKSFDNTELSFAKLIFYLGKNIFVFTNKIWYKFDNHSWKCDKISDFKVFIFDNVIEHYQKVIKFYENKNEDINKINFIKNIKQNISLLVIENNVYLENYFFNNDFITNLNKNPYLIGFNNGIFDLESMEFRSGKSIDMVSFSVGYDYVDNHAVNLLITLLFPNDLIRHYTLKLLGSCLFSEFDMSHLFVFTGYGTNSKKLFLNLIKETFGEYFVSFTYTSDIHFNNLLIQRKKITLLIYENIEDLTIKKNINEHNKILNNIIDQYYKLEIKPTHLILVSDRLPNIFNNKIKMIEIPINTTIDNEIQEKKNIKKNKNIFMNELIQYYNIYEKEKIDNLDELTKIKNILNSDYNNIFKEYTDIYIIKTNDIDDIVKWTELKIHFKNWMFSKTNKQLSSVAFKKDFEAFFGVPERMVRSKYTNRTQIRGWNFFTFIS